MQNSPIIMLCVKEIPTKYQGISEHAVRRWVTSGELPSVKAGRKILIAEPVLTDFLLGNIGKNQTEDHRPKIKKIN